MSRVRAGILTGYGINADEELALAFRTAGAETPPVHAGDLVADPGLLGDLDILAFPGGFSFGDHLGSGKVLAHLLGRSVRPALERFVADGGLVIGICNGFQVLVKMGLLPDLAGRWEPEVTLVHNESGVFEDRWVKIAFDPASPCAWTRGLAPMDVPVRHGEGRFVARDPAVLAAIHEAHLAAARYVPFDGGTGPARYPDNPNGSVDGIAGISDRTGRVFGMMPHPEAFLFPENHPTWTRAQGGGGVADARGGGHSTVGLGSGARAARHGDGLAIFANGVAAASRRGKGRRGGVRRVPG